MSSAGLVVLQVAPVCSRITAGLTVSRTLLPVSRDAGARKNVPLLLRAYAHFVREWISGSAPPLLIAGATGWMASDLPGLAAELGVSEQVRHLGFIPREDLPLLMNCATASSISVLTRARFSSPRGDGVRVPVIANDVSSLQRWLAKPDCLSMRRT